MRDCSREIPSELPPLPQDRKSTRLNSSHGYISYAVFCLKKKQNDAFQFQDGDLLLAHFIASDAGEQRIMPWPKASRGRDRYVAAFAPRDPIDPLDYDSLPRQR